MRTVRGLFAKLVTRDHLEAAATKTCAGKRLRPDVAWFLFRREEQVGEIQRRLETGSWAPLGWRARAIRDPKPRVIAVAPIEDRVVHTAVVSLLEPVFLPMLTRDVFACRPGFGTHRAVIRLVELMRRHAFFLHLDIRAYFPSVHVDTLIDLVRRRVRDAEFLRVVDVILDAGRGFYDPVSIRRAARIAPDWPPPGRGLPIGALTSQLFAAHVYLAGLDHHVKRDLKVPGYVRYVDDLVLFGDERSGVERWRDQVGAWLMGERQLRLKAPWAKARSTWGTLHALGQAITRSGATPLPSCWRAFDGMAREFVHRAGARRSRRLDASVASRVGHLMTL